VEMLFLYRWTWTLIATSTVLAMRIRLVVVMVTRMWDLIYPSSLIAPGSMETPRLNPWPSFLHTVHTTTLAVTPRQVVKQSAQQS
jgi:hypothetical protein